MKYGITQNLTADLTYNTDFAQVEADEQQVNLTRFSLFFPEKREFFLENQGTFAFGGAATAARRPTPATRRCSSTAGASASNQGRAVPIHRRRPADRPRRPLHASACSTSRPTTSRVSGTPTTNFSVVRLKRDVLRRSSVGVIYTGRSVAQNRRRAQRRVRRRRDVRVLRQPDDQHLLGAHAHRRRRGRRRHQPPRAARLRRRPLRRAGRAPGRRRRFNPEIGFVRRADMRRHFGQVRFSPRPRAEQDGAQVLLHRRRSHTSKTAPAGSSRATGTASSRSSSTTAITCRSRYRRTYEFLPAPFAIATGVIVPVGGYDFGTTSAGYTFGQQRPVSGNVSVEARHVLQRAQDDAGGAERPVQRRSALLVRAHDLRSTGSTSPRARSRRRSSARASPTR